MNGWQQFVRSFAKSSAAWHYKKKKGISQFTNVGEYAL